MTVATPSPRVLSDFTVEEIQGNKSYMLLPCECVNEVGVEGGVGGGVGCGEELLRLPYRTYPSSKPPTVPFNVDLEVEENAVQNTTLETGGAIWDGAVYLVRFLNFFKEEFGIGIGEGGGGITSGITSGGASER